MKMQRLKFSNTSWYNSENHGEGYFLNITQNTHLTPIAKIIVMMKAKGQSQKYEKNGKGMCYIYLCAVCSPSRSWWETDDELKLGSRVKKQKQKPQRILEHPNFTKEGKLEFLQGRRSKRGDL